MHLLVTIAIWAAASSSPTFSTNASMPLSFSRPVLIGSSRPAAITGVNYSHFWFPEMGGVIGGRVPGDQQAILVGFRFNGDGGAPTPLHTYETMASWDGGGTWQHHSWTYFNGMPTRLDAATGDLLGVCCFQHGSPDNKTFVGSRVRYRALPNRTVVSETTGVATYTFPFSVARLTYMGAMVAATKNGSALVQTVAYSHKLNEIGGADENLAAFRSTDGGATWVFAQVVASRNATLAARKWEGPGENDVVRRLRTSIERMRKYSSRPTQLHDHKSIRTYTLTHSLTHSHVRVLR